MAIRGVKSNPPAVGINRRSGASTGSTIRSSSKVSVLGLVTNQERMALARMATVSTSKKSLSMMKTCVTLPPQLPGALIGGAHRPDNCLVKPGLVELRQCRSGGAAGGGHLAAQFRRVA